jgi:two-component system sensor histidine kinase HydH
MKEEIWSVISRTEMFPISGHGYCFLNWKVLQGEELQPAQLESRLLMRILQRKRLYLPALTIVTVVFLLLVILGISTYRNLDREKKMAMNSLHRQGLALLRSLEAGARAGMMMPMWQEDSVGNLLQEIGKSDDIDYVYLANDKGIISHHSDPSRDGEPSNQKSGSLDENQVTSRIIKLPDGSQVYELAKRFRPLAAFPRMSRYQQMMRRHRMMPSHIHGKETVVLGMKMTAFEEARSADLQHALIMTAILLVLGTGALFFIFVIQNYYLVDKTLKETEDYTAQVVANMANGLLSMNSEGRVVSYNQLALELLGLNEVKLKGMNLQDVMDFQKSGIVHTLSECSPSLDREILHRQPSGEEVPLAVSVTPILGREDECKGAVMVLRDLREIKRLEEEVRRSEKLAAIGKLAAGVAHEIRNPLSSIRGFSQFLRHALTERPKEQEYAEVMVKEVDRINKVVTDLLTFSRPMAAELAPSDLRELMEHVVRLVQADAQESGVEIHMNVALERSDFPLDSNQITQALLNLMLNGLQASESGGRIEIGAATSKTGSRLHIWVEDDGPGIPEEQMRNIFDPFFTTREEGSGLGLAIVHTIVENHRGEVRVKSPAPGRNRGSRFTISLPIEDA